MNRRFKSLAATLIGSFALNACASGGKSMSLEFWIADNIDVAVAYAHLPDGRLLIRKGAMYPYRIDSSGWIDSGPEVLSHVKELPDHLMISWRLPSPNESPAERCWRRFEKNCATLPGNDALKERDDGQLIGPIKVPIRTRLNADALALLSRRGTFNTLELGVGIGKSMPLLRWRLIGTPIGAAPNSGAVTALEKGGDW